MTGLNLETFLRIVRADLGAWVSLGAVAVILGIMTWTSWGSKRALRKCLFLSIAAHVGLIVYGGSSPVLREILRLDRPEKPAPPERPVRITPVVVERTTARPVGGPSAPRVADWDLDRGSLAFGAPGRLTPPAPAPREGTPGRVDPGPVATPSVAPELEMPTPSLAPPGRPTEPAPPPPTPDVAEGDSSEIAAPVATVVNSPDIPPPSVARARAGPNTARPVPERSRPIDSALPEPPRVDIEAPRISPRPEKLGAEPASPKPVEPTTSATDLDPNPPVDPSPVIASSPTDVSPAPAIRRPSRPTRDNSSGANAPTPTPARSTAAALPTVTPAGPSNAPASARPVGRRPPLDVPQIYRSRLDPNRTVLAQRAGATVESEQAVERALDWLARHQDAADGRWDGGTARFRDGSVALDDDSFTIHCPAGEVCFGECFYWEADTALTGLSLLAFLGSGYTHQDGKYAPTVGKGIDFLLRSQKRDGDLRGQSQAVGMYCHAMATLALCEAYALTGDEKLRPAVEKAAGFLVRSRAVDGLAWRYAPGAPSGDTSILGWVVMALKSAKAVGIPIPPETQAGILGWLRNVSSGRDGGLAFYNFDATGTKVTPTMTAEAWACRQFLEVGGPGLASEEAANHLLANPTDRAVEYNIYYLYYGTWRCTNTAATPGRPGTAGSATRSSAASGPRGTWPGAGTRTTVPMGPRAGGFTARRWPR